MIDSIVLYFKDLQSDQVSWYPLGSRPSAIAPKGQGTLAEAANEIKGWRHSAVVASPELFLTKVDIPAKNRQRLIQAIPFALENDLTEELEELHFAHEANSSDGIAVSVVSRQRLSSWLERLKQHNLEPRGLYPAVLGLPFSSGNWSVYWSETLCLVRTGINAGFVADPDNAEILLKQALNQSPVIPVQLDLFSDSSSLNPESPLQDLQVPLRIVNDDTDISRLIAENLDEKHRLNLLQGEYKQVDNRSLQWRRWLPAAILFGCYMGFGVVSTVIDHIQAKHLSRQIAQQTHQLFRETFPEIKRIVDPKVQMEQQLKQLRSGGKTGDADFLGLLTPSAGSLKLTPGSQLDSISYRDGQLDMKMKLKDLQSLDAIKKSLESQNLTVEIRSANASGSQITSHLRITRGGA